MYFYFLCLDKKKEEEEEDVCISDNNNCQSYSSSMQQTIAKWIIATSHRESVAKPMHSDILFIYTLFFVHIKLHFRWPNIYFYAGMIAILFLNPFEMTLFCVLEMHHKKCWGITKQ